jgi:hypothetical protein
MRLRTIGVSIVAAALLAPATTMAVDYPPPSDPGQPTKRPSGGKTLKVCKKGKRCFKTIQKAVNAAKRGDTIKIANGKYHEGVKIKGRKKEYLRLIGNKKNPRKVVIDSKGVKGAAAQNGVIVNGANNVTLTGLFAQHYKGNGFFAVNVTGYDFSHLVAGNGGSYGIYAFNSKGGRITDSEAFYNNDGGFYIGQTPVQTKPRRTFTKNLTSWGNVIGWSGTNMRYVTITQSKFFNNAVGIVPNALDSEKFPPAEDNVIYGNEVFWNNFDYTKGAPFKLRDSATSFPYPPGTGIILFGGRRNRVENNVVYGNWLTGSVTITQFVLEQKDAADPVGNLWRGNQFGLNGTDLNGYDMFYDGGGSDNCFADNVLHSPNIPSDGENPFAVCPFTGENTHRSDVLNLAAEWVLDPVGSHWIRHDHAPKPGYNPLELWTKDYDPGSAVR